MAIWTYHANDQSPAAVATVFAASAFSDERELVDVHGHWSDAGWDGTFRLRGGLRRYRLTGRRGRWTVEAIDDTKGED